MSNAKKIMTLFVYFYKMHAYLDYPEFSFLKKLYIIYFIYFHLVEFNQIILI